MCVQNNPSTKHVQQPKVQKFVPPRYTLTTIAIYDNTHCSAGGVPDESTVVDHNHPLVY